MKRVVITGGSGGLGRAVSRVFADAGWRVDSLASGDLDVTDPRAVTAYFSAEPLDLLVCCAGIISDGPLLRLGEEDWDRTLAVNFKGAAACARAVIPGMAGRREGHIVFISSHSAIHPPAGQAAYATAKAALLGLTTDLARLHGPDNIRINAVLPGFLETPMTAAVSDKRREEILADHCLGRFNTPAATAKFIHDLHHHLPHTSGQVFRLDNRP